MPARAGASPAATRGRSRRRARTRSTSSASPNGAPATPGAAAARRETACGDSDNSSQRPRASVVIRWKGHQNERRHSARRNPRETPPTTPSTPAPPHPLPPPQAPSPPSTARGPAVRDARRGRRARDVGVSSRTAHPTGEPTGARPRARAYEGEATRNNVVGGAGPVPNQVSVCQEPGGVRFTHRTQSAGGYFRRCPKAVVPSQDDRAWSGLQPSRTEWRSGTSRLPWSLPTTLRPLSVLPRSRVQTPQQDKVEVKSSQVKCATCR